MKITVYTVSDCQFSKAEKDYLTAHNLPYEEKNLELNREWLTEMLVVSNNFAGTPVTKIEKDDGQIIVLKGFTQEEFDQVLGFKKEEPVDQSKANLSTPPPPQPNSTQPSSTNQSQTQPPPFQTTPPQPSPPQVFPIDQNQTETQSPNQPINPSSTNTQTTQTADPLSSVLSNLAQKANLNQQNQPSSQSPPTNIPNIPDFNE